MDQLADLLRRGAALAGRVERADLSERLDRAGQRTGTPEATVLVVGARGRGASSLVNALVNAPLCPVDSPVAAGLPVIVGYGDTTAALMGRGSGRGATGRAARTPLGVDEVARHAVEADAGRFSGIEVKVPRRFLRGGLVLVDLPGGGPGGIARAMAAFARIREVQAVLVVTDATRPAEAEDRRLLQAAAAIAPRVIRVVTKADLVSGDSRTVASPSQDADPSVSTFAVSSALRYRAIETEDLDLNAASGFVELIDHLRDVVVPAVERREVLRRAHDLLDVADELRRSVDAEREALRSPQRMPQILIELEQVRQEADDLRASSAAWQTTLSDGIADLIADMEHDLRDRVRAVQRATEAAIDGGDPGPLWHRTVPWLDDRFTEAITETFVWTQERAGWLAERVADHFDDDVARPGFALDEAEQIYDLVPSADDIDSGLLTVSQRFYMALRGSYGGILMIGIFTALVGMPIINPLSLAAGAVVGRKAYNDEQAVRLQRRRGEAKNLVRRQADDVVFHVGKRLRDELRLVQRAMRDHFTAIAAERQQSIQASLQATQRAATAFTHQREARLAALEEEAVRITTWRRAIQDLAEGGSGAGAGAGTAAERGRAAPRPSVNTPAVPVAG